MADRDDDAVRVGNAGDVAGNQPSCGVQHQTQASEVPRNVLKGTMAGTATPREGKGGRHWGGIGWGGVGRHGGRNGNRNALWASEARTERRSCRILLFSILSYPIISYPILSYPILSYPILSYLILSYPILSYPILFCPIVSYSVYLRGPQPHDASSTYLSSPHSLVSCNSLNPLSLPSPRLPVSRPSSPESPCSPSRW